MKKIKDEKLNLEDKLKNLLDILYGCNECGLCECECDYSNSVKGEANISVSPQCVTTSEPYSPPATPLHTPAAQHLP